LGEIPAHWEVRRLKTIAFVQLSNVDKKSVEGQESVRLCNYVDVYYNERITADLDFMPATATAEQVRRFALHTGDVLITKDSESWTDIAVPAVVTSDLPSVLCGYHLALIRPASDYYGGFLARAFSAIGPRDQFQIAANGITRFGLGGDAIRTGIFAVPPVPEQRAIAAFLDRELAKLDALVEKKERLIELLQEKRTALITRAVTKGIAPNVPIENSDVEWLGEIPAHWEVTRLRYGCSLLRDGTHQPPPRVAVGYPLLSVRNITDGKLTRLPDDSMISEADFHSLERSFAVLENDVLLAVVGATMGKVAIVGPIEPFAVQRSLAVLRPRPELLQFTYLAAFLESQPFQYLLWQNAGYSAQPGIYLSALGSFHIPLPPIGEQSTIMECLRRATEDLESLIGCVREGISRLKELRIALISAAVTGKIDVRAEGP